MDEGQYIVGDNALDGEGWRSPERAHAEADHREKFRKRLSWWHFAADESGLATTGEGHLYFALKGWLALMEKGGKGLNAIAERDMSTVLARDVRDMRGWVEKLEGLGWIEIFDPGRGGPSLPHSEHRAAIYGLGDEQLLMPVFEAMALQARQHDLRDWESAQKEMEDQFAKDWGFQPADGYAVGVVPSQAMEYPARTLETYLIELWDLYDSEYAHPRGSGEGGTSLGHHYLRDAVVGVHHQQHQGSGGSGGSGGSEESEESNLTPRGNGGPVRWATEIGKLTNLVPTNPLATSPMDYATGSDAWTEKEAGVRGWLLARQVVGWSKTPAWLHEATHTFSGPDLARMVGMAPKNGHRLAKRLRDRGYAKETEDGRWYLKFQDLFWEGRFFIMDERQQLLRARNADRREEDPDEAQFEDTHRMARSVVTM